MELHSRKSLYWQYFNELSGVGLSHSDFNRVGLLFGSFGEILIFYVTGSSSGFSAHRVTQVESNRIIIFRGLQSREITAVPARGIDNVKSFVKSDMVTPN